MRVIDGMHRLCAAKLRGKETIDVRHFHGNDEEAFMFAVKVNVTHGFPLTSADRAAAVRRILMSYPSWSDRAFAAATILSAVVRRPRVDAVRSPPSPCAVERKITKIDRRKSVLR